MIQARWQALKPRRCATRLVVLRLTQESAIRQLQTMIPITPLAQAVLERSQPAKSPAKSPDKS